VILWNNRLTNTTPFLRAYEELLLRPGTDYAQVDHKNITPEVLQEFFGNRSFKLKLFPNAQVFDWEGLKGRALSSSYVPQEGHPGHVPFVQELNHLFVTHNCGGDVTFEYETQVYYGALK